MMESRPYRGRSARRLRMSILGVGLGALALFLSALAPPLGAQSGAENGQALPSASAQKPQETQNTVAGSVFTLLNMAGTRKAKDFTPLDQHGRNRSFLRSLVNPLSFVRVGFSAGLDQWQNKPGEWAQGGEGYGKRYANIFGQYTIQRTASFGLASVLDEDNRYFNSGKRGFFPRVWYAVESGVLARHHDGHRSFSFSQAGSVAAGAFLARLWLPPSQNKMSNAGISFALSTVGNMGGNIVKEFVPDIVRVFSHKSSGDR